MLISEQGRMALRVSQLTPGPGYHTTEKMDRLANTFAEFVDTKSPYTSQHSHGVARASIGIARVLRLPYPTQVLIHRAALLHDIGKLMVPDEILHKSGPLSRAEWEIMREHPVYTRCILEGSGAFADLAAIASAHHERLDGSGYPDGLTARELPLEARIIAVADVFDALSNPRPYREEMAWDDVRRFLLREAGETLDAAAVIALTHWHDEFSYVERIAVA